MSQAGVSRHIFSFCPVSGQTKPYRNMAHDVQIYISILTLTFFVSCTGIERLCGDGRRMVRFTADEAALINRLGGNGRKDTAANQPLPLTVRTSLEYTCGACRKRENNGGKTLPTRLMQPMNRPALEGTGNTALLKNLALKGSRQYISDQEPAGLSGKGCVQTVEILTGRSWSRTAFWKMLKTHTKKL